MAAEDHESAPARSTTGDSFGFGESHSSLYSKRYCCYCIPLSNSNQSRPIRFGWWQRIQGRDDDEEGWWCRGLRALIKVREWSEIIAGPRWKTFIRRFNRTRSGGHRRAKFQYDPLSYSLNFDESSGQIDQGDDCGGFRDFSVRYASDSGMIKPGMASV